MNPGTWRVIGSKGCGSALVEAALVIAKIPYEHQEVEAHATQIPTVILPDGTTLTESAAVMLYIDGLVPELGLVPPANDPLRKEMLRWLMFLVAAVYPTFTAEGEQGSEEHRQSLWRLVEGAVRGPWFLGELPSALDLYVAVMTRWEPGRAWIADGCPRLHTIALAVDEDPRLTTLWAAHFD
jgi:GST-like protein